MADVLLSLQSHELRNSEIFLPDSDSKVSNFKKTQKNPNIGSSRSNVYRENDAQIFFF